MGKRVWHVIRSTSSGFKPFTHWLYTASLTDVLWSTKKRYSCLYLEVNTTCWSIFMVLSSYNWLVLLMQLYEFARQNFVPQTWRCPLLPSRPRPLNWRHHLMLPTADPGKPSSSSCLQNWNRSWYKFFISKIRRWRNILRNVIRAG